MANVERCAKCGAVIALVGLRHNCAPRTEASVVVLPVVRFEPSPESGTYRHREPETRRAYMRAYMREWRARKKSSGAAAEPRAGQ